MIDQGLARHRGAFRDGFEIMRCLGGHELAAIAGAALAIPIVRAAALCHSGMATFAEAGVSNKQ